MITFETVCSYGRKIGYRAKLGEFEADGKTQAAAKAALLALVKEAPRFNPVVMVGSDGGTWVLWHDLTSYVYRTPSGCLTVLSTKEKNEARRFFEEHFAQYYEVQS